MKRVLIILLVFIPFLGMPQGCKQIDKLYRKYASKEGVTTFNLGYLPLKFSGFVCRLAGYSEEAKLLKGVNGIRILTVENEKLNKTLDFYKELESEGFFKDNDYESLMEVTNKNESVHFYCRDAGDGKFSELLLITGGNENTLISIRGNIDASDIGKITGALNLNPKVKDL
jgi:hypothetical protein